MVLPFLLPIPLQYILPAYAVIIRPTEVVDMISYDECLLL